MRARFVARARDSPLVPLRCVLLIIFEQGATKMAIGSGGLTIGGTGVRGSVTDLYRSAFWPRFTCTTLDARLWRCYSGSKLVLLQIIEG